MRLRLPPLLAGGAVLVALALVSSPVVAAPALPSAPIAPAVPAPSDYTPPAPVWGACSDPTLKQFGAECAKISVPLDYSKPTGAKIKLAISRQKHTAKRYQGVMLMNPGGPGGSGLVLSIYRDFIPHDAGQGYDWIGFDPRGVGASEPRVSCNPTYFGYNRPRYVPASPALEDAWFARTTAYAKACDAKNGPILDHLTTVDSVKDMDSIRAALGQKQINYYGFSYGTYLGQVYADFYPKRLRRVVFDGTVDPRGVWYGDNLGQDRAFEKDINIWFGWLARYDSVYHLGKTQAAVRSLFYRTQERLSDDPVTAAGGKLGGSEWADAFLYAGYGQWSWTDLAKVFSGFVHDDDVDALEGAYLDANGYGDDNLYAVYLGVQCTDTAWPQKWSTWKKDNWRVFVDAPFYTWANAWFNEPCRHWPAKPRKQVDVDGKNVGSILMINETLDGATPYAGSLEVRSRFKKARLIKVPGGTTHANSLAGNACVDDRIAAYLADGSLPKRKSGRRADVSCAPLPQPDPTAPSAQRKAKGTSAADLLKQRQKAAVRP